jgi:hypothetical protein
MSREENIELAKKMLERSENSTTQKELSNEDVWGAIKRNIFNLSNEFDMCVTDTDLERVAHKSDAFNKFATNALKGLSDDYAEKHRYTEYALREEEIRVRKAHEINEAIRLTQTNPEAGQAIINGMMNLLGSGMTIPKELAKVKTIETSADEEIIADVSLSEE